MKTFLTLLVLITLTMSSFAQSKLNSKERSNFNRLLNKGIELFNAERTNDALESFKKAEAIDPESWKLNFWLANCHYDLMGFLTAEIYINVAKKFITEHDDADAAFYELEGKINHRIAKVDEAIAAYKKTAVLLGPKVALDYGINRYIEQCELMIRDKKQGVDVKRTSLSKNINSLNDEYAPLLVNGGRTLFFTSRRPETTGENINPDDLRYFEDVYRANWNESTKNFEIDYSFFKEINTNGFDAMSYINSNGTYALMTVNTSSAEKTTKSSDLFEIISEQPFVWEAPAVIKSKGINTDYFEGSATTTEGASEGEILVFTTDRKADLTGLDLYTCTRSENGFGEVSALPKHINSPGNETTPWLSPDGKFLFFSSDELPGYGDYDIFYCTLKEDGTWSNPMNLGPSINTVNNDTHFNLISGENKAVYASLAEQDGFYSYDLFQVDLNGLNFPFAK
jgi:tetratricopeptide (TPR) repeat protein